MHVLPINIQVLDLLLTIIEYLLFIHVIYFV